jgi:hypothetical protein
VAIWDQVVGDRSKGAPLDQGTADRIMGDIPVTLTIISVAGKTRTKMDLGSEMGLSPKWSNSTFRGLTVRTLKPGAVELSNFSIIMALSTLNV